MANKLDLFELSLKRGLENVVEPWNEADWKDMKGRLGNLNAGGTSGQSGFLGHFGLAAAVLAGLAVVFVNPSSPESGVHESTIVAETASSRETSSEKDTDYVLTELDDTSLSASDSVSDEITSLEAEELNAESMEREGRIEENLSSSEKERILSINERLQQAAQKNKEESAEGKITTRYVGKDFDLGALRMFSPNNDGNKDVFMPSTLSESDIFLLSITDDAGKSIYRTTTVDRPWTGKDSAGKEMPAGHYSWEVTLQKDGKKEIFRGVVRLDR
jgi:gliding motility-associated-like protein